MNAYKVERNHCTCHPETCCCNDWKVIGPDGKTFVTTYEKSKSDEIAAAMNKANKT